MVSNYRLWRTLFSAVLLAFIQLVIGKRWPDLYWNTSNSIFQEGLSADKFLTFAVNEHDAMDFVCPCASATTNSCRQAQQIGPEFLAVYMVSEMSFLTCQLDSNSVQFLVCDDSSTPTTLLANRKRKKVVFRQFSPTPDAIVFTPGSSYYFISTSNGSLAGLQNTQRGLCFSKNMRLKIDFASNGSASEKENAADQMEFIIEERAEYSMNPPSSSNQDGSSRGVEGNGRNNVNLADIFQINPEYMEFVRNHAVRGGTGEIRFPTEDSRFPNVDGVNVIKKPRFVSTGSKGRKKDYRDEYLQASSAASTTFSPGLSNELEESSVMDTNEYLSLRGSEKQARRTAAGEEVNAAKTTKITSFSFLLGFVMILAL